jgi:hypothetical protein
MTVSRADLACVMMVRLPNWYGALCLSIPDLSGRAVLLRVPAFVLR